MADVVAPAKEEGKLAPSREGQGRVCVGRSGDAKETVTALDRERKSIDTLVTEAVGLLLSYDRNAN